MEMSIKEAHRILSNGLANAPSEHEWCVAFKIAIDTMQKYQIMQGVLEKVWNTSSCTLDKTPTFNFECLNEIMETYRTVR